GLRHPRVIGRDVEQGERHRTDAAEHRRDELLVTGYIDEGDRGAGEIRPREPELDRESALAFGLQPIRIHAREGTHQRRLTVIDVPGRRDDHRPLGHAPPSARTRWRALMRVASSRGSTAMRSRSTCPSRTRPITAGRSARGAAAGLSGSAAAARGGLTAGPPPAATAASAPAP